MRINRENEGRLTVEELRSLLRYDRSTGIFYWLKSRRGVRRDMRAGTVQSNGYIQIEINGIAYYAQRLAWLYVKGKWPEHQVDHRDLNKSNNSWHNLREATQTQNSLNSKARRGTKTGLKGVTPSSKCSTFAAQITISGKTRKLGHFRTPEEAHAAYCEAAKEAHGIEFWRGK